MASCGEGGEAATVAARQAEPSAGPSPRIQALAGGGDGGDGIGNETAWASYETVRRMAWGGGGLALLSKGAAQGGRGSGSRGVVGSPLVGWLSR